MLYFHYSDDVKELLMHLVLFKCDKEAESLQKIFELVLKLAEEKIPVIWVPDVDEIQNSVSWKPQVVKNAIHVCSGHNHY